MPLATDTRPLAIALTAAGPDLSGAVHAPLIDLTEAVPPPSARGAHTRIECAVFNFGVREGPASSREGVALRTDQLTVLGGGLVDLKTEGIDIGVQPKPRSGSGLNVASLGGDLVRIGGTHTAGAATQEGSTIDRATDSTKQAVRKTGEAVQGALKKLFGRWSALCRGPKRGCRRPART